MLPDAGIVTIYSDDIANHPERYRNGQTESVIMEGMHVMEAMPIGRRMFRRDVLKRAGYFREDFGLYGREDIEWAYRVERVCLEMGLKCYLLPDLRATHLGTEGNFEFETGGDSKEYHEFKQRELANPWQQQLLEYCEANNWPYYTPY